MQTARQTLSSVGRPQGPPREDVETRLPHVDGRYPWLVQQQPEDSTSWSSLAALPRNDAGIAALPALTYFMCSGSRKCGVLSRAYLESKLAVLNPENNSGSQADLVLPATTTSHPAYF